MLGEMTVSVLKGEGGFQRKEIDKFIDWVKDEAPPDVVNLPYTLLLGLAEPIKQGFENADRVHAPGRGSLSRRPSGALPQRESLEL